MVNHADVGCFGSSVCTEGIGEKFAADFDFPVPVLDSFLKGADGGGIDTGFDEDSFDFFGCDCVCELDDGLSGGFGDGVGALDSEDLEVEAFSVVLEGVVGSDQHTAIFGN